MSNPCNEKNRLFILTIAAAIQYVGASAKRKFIFLLKILITTIPGLKNSMDTALNPHQFNFIENTLEKLLPSEEEDDDDRKHTVEVITDIGVDLLFWFFSFVASVLVFLGVLLESITGLIADLLRSKSICQNGYNDFSLKKSVRKFFQNIDSTNSIVKELIDLNMRWKIDSNVVNTDYSDAVPKPENDVPKEIINKSYAFSFAAQESNYIDSGVRYDFLLKNGKIHFGKKPSGLKGLQATNNPDLILYPFKMKSTGLSFHKFRQGEKVTELKFDMVAASNDRVFVKVEGKSDFYFAVMDEMFSNSGNGGPTVPSIYFKLDPQFGATDRHGNPLESSQLVQQISDSDGKLLNYPNHPQAERLPALHSAIGMGLLDAMIVSVKPRTWYRLDTRPPLHGVKISSSDGSDMPSSNGRRIFPKLVTQYNSRQAAKYEGKNLSSQMSKTQKKNEFTYTKVLSIGVGNFHYYESWTDDYGGELQPLHQNGPFNLPINMSLYALFNGPSWDGDGACDGTCNFYILVKLNNYKSPYTDQKYGILWCDEQTYFTKRWRLLDPRDNEPWKIDFPYDINLSLTAALRRDQEKGLLNQQYNFNYKKYINSDPFQLGLINDNSRMSVARQIVLVTGKKAGVSKLFSINFSYGSIDRYWRSRNYPDKATVDNGLPTPSNTLNTFTVFPKTINIREDMNITVEGSHKRLGVGKWFQRYLPCNRQHPEENKEYSHPWYFLPENAFNRADSFSHLGVYDQVDSRNQYYTVEVVESSPPIPSHPLIVRDFEKRLKIQGLKFNWGLFKDEASLTNFLEDKSNGNHLPERIRQGTELEALSEKLLFRWDQKIDDTYSQYRNSQTSAHQKQAKFRLLNRGPLGYILTWHDKRDDDLISLSNLPQIVTMKSQGLFVKLRIIKNVRVTSLPNVHNVRLSLIGNILKIEIDTEQNEISAIANLWSIQIAALPEDGDSGLEIIYKTENLFKHKRFKSTYNAASNKLKLEAEVKVNDNHIDYLKNKDSALINAVSVWFEDVVGHVSTPDSIKVIS